jgi:DNA-nicking Smr family endonuclease
MRKRHERRLTEDDLEVWRAAARTMRPLKPEPAPDLSHPPPPAPPPPEPAPPLAPFRVGERSPAPRSAHGLVPALPERLAADALRMDARTHARMVRGKLRPERKLDLHGMTLAQAHPALIRFVLTAHAEGVRLAIVVTGKGRERADDGPIPAPRGLLRHQVPAWLTAPPLRAVVLQVAQAHVRHGGGGALYVYLRRS